MCTYQIIRKPRNNVFTGKPTLKYQIVNEVAQIFCATSFWEGLLTFYTHGVVLHIALVKRNCSVLYFVNIVCNSSSSKLICAF